MLLCFIFFIEYFPRYLGILNDLGLNLDKEIDFYSACNLSSESETIPC
jgi:hypothetical protein